MAIRQLMAGITPHKVNTIAFAIGIGLAGLAGIATATTYSFDPYFGFIFSLEAMILSGPAPAILAILIGLPLLKEVSMAKSG
jgi:branched-subunit amino acid ABC-type transport system permease component